ncbi:MAG TPA: magnesium transporter CorA family protein, partial [Acidimicrobiales bacterium]
RPKLERYPNHAFIVAYSADLAEVDMFVGRDWVLTVRGPNADGRVWDCEQAAVHFERVDGYSPSVGALLHAVLDALVDGYFERADGIEDRIEAIEDSVFAEELRTEHDIQRELFVVRRELLEFRRAVAPLRDVVAAVLRRELDWVQGDDLFAYQDVFDHLLRVLDQIDVERELMGNAVEAHLAIISNRMNRVMKTMTSWGAILFGSGLIAGVYGMNFRHMPELDWYLGYPMALAMMAGLTTSLVLYFRRKDWL